MKKRILEVGESSFLATGYAVYAAELLKRLHATNKYEIAEFGCYGEPNDPRISTIPWKFYHNIPETPELIEEYQSNPLNQFGEWRFEKVCLDWKPDIICSFVDTWMCSYQQYSPFRDYYYWVWLTTCDSMPQKEDWIAQMMNCDRVLTYSDWALDLLKDVGGGLINLYKSAPIGVDFSVFEPVGNKPGHKKKMGLPEDMLVVGTVMRNQPRKLYPQLVDAFVEFLGKAPAAIARKTYLYLHTAYPDRGWNLPSIIRNAGITHKVFFTYICRRCGAVFPSFFQDARGTCRKCGSFTAMMPTTNLGVSRSTLASIYNLFDVYVQYANCLAKGTEVLMEEGWTPIEEVKRGDIAYTHNGNWKPVLRTFRHTVGDNVKEIKFWGLPEGLTITNEHPILALKRKAQYSLPTFIKVKDLSIGDFVAYRIDDTVEDINTLDIAPYKTPTSIVSDDSIYIPSSHKTYARCIYVNNDFCKFLGLFITDGYNNVGKGHINIACNSSQPRNIDFSIKMLQRIAANNCVLYEYETCKAVDVRLCSFAHSQLFKSLCGVGVHQSLPEWAAYLPIEKQKSILQGLFMADRHYSTCKGRTVSIYTTTSPKLYKQIVWLLRRCRIGFNCIFQKPTHSDRKNKRKRYRFEVASDIAAGEFITERRFYYNNYHYSVIKAIYDSNYQEDVYNLEVKDDNSYTINVSNLHNSGGFEAPQIEAAACGIPVMSTDYSAMTDVVRKIKGYPIKVNHLNLEMETDCYRASPDQADFVEKLIKYLSMPESMKSVKQFETRKAVEQHYNWDDTAKVWQEVFDSFEKRSSKDTWNSSPRLYQPNINVPPNLNNEEFVRWILQYVMGKPEWVNSYLATRLIRDLNWGFKSDSMSKFYFHEASTLSEKAHLHNRFTRENAIAEMINMRDHYNKWEARR